MWGNNTGLSSGLLPGRRVLGPLFLMMATPVAAVLFCHTIRNEDGSVAALFDGLFGGMFTEPDGWSTPFRYIANAWPSTSAEGWAIVGAFAAFQLLLMRLVPGRPFNGPVTPMGNTPHYTGNGMQCFYITMIAYLVAVYGVGAFEGGFVYEHFPAVLAACLYSSFLLCLFLYFKGLYFPSSTDCGSSGNPVFDFYWGTELYPRILGWDVKMFTNCRFGMMGWAVIVLDHAAWQLQHNGNVSDSMLVSVVLQLVYIQKFFWWESGYMCSIDIHQDRGGYYLVWGCMNWVPVVYTLPSTFLVEHPVQLGAPLTAAFLFLGCLSIFVNYDADRQRQHVRQTNGNCLVWGRTPELIRATYTTGQGKRHHSLLLASGYWGIARHFHYVPEILGAFFWSVPALFTHFLPYFYVFPYLVLLLVDRAFRDDARCSSKYGKYWNQYRAKVPYKIIPGIL